MAWSSQDPYDQMDTYILHTYMNYIYIYKILAPIYPLFCLKRRSFRSRIIYIYYIYLHDVISVILFMVQKSCTQVEVGSWYHCLQGFIHPKDGKTRRISEPYIVRLHIPGPASSLPSGMRCSLEGREEVGGSYYHSHRIHLWLYI